MTEIPVGLIVVLTVGTVAAVVLSWMFTRARRELRGWRSRAAELETEHGNSLRRSADLAARLQAAEAEVRHLAGARIPDTAAALAHAHVPVRGPLGTVDLGPDLEQYLDSALEQVREAVTRERLRVDFAAQAAMRGATTTIQALLYQVQTLLQRMQEKYDDPLVAEDLLAADFLNEQALRRIQSTAVVCGAWPGLTRDNSHLADIVVGATSRITGYERVQVSNQLRDPVGVVARAVEPVAVVLTELIANALHYSHPELPVSVTLQQGSRGASVIVDDAGVGMHQDEITRAQQLMSGEETVLLTELGDPPRSGFAAIGRLVRQYGFATHVEASPYGGVRAIVHIPGEPLLTLIDEEEQPLSAMAPMPTGGVPPLPGRSSTEHVPEAPVASAAPAAPAAPAAAQPAPATPAFGASGSRTPGEAADGPGPSGAPGEPGGDPPAPASENGLPRRRRKRPAVPDDEPAHARAESDSAESRPESAPEDTPSPGAHPPSSPEESAQRWAAFQRGTESGRAAVDAAEAGENGAGEPVPESAAEKTTRLRVEDLRAVRAAAGGATPAPHAPAPVPDGPRQGAEPQAEPGTGPGAEPGAEHSADRTAQHRADSSAQPSEPNSTPHGANHRANQRAADGASRSAAEGNPPA